MTSENNVIEIGTNETALASGAAIHRIRTPHYRRLFPAEVLADAEILGEIAVPAKRFIYSHQSTDGKSYVNPVPFYSAAYRESIQQLLNGLPGLNGDHVANIKYIHSINHSLLGKQEGLRYDLSVVVRDPELTGLKGFEDNVKALINNGLNATVMSVKFDLVRHGKSDLIHHLQPERLK